MPIKSITLGQAGLAGVLPREVYIETDDSVATVTATGYLNQAYQQGFLFSPSDLAQVVTKESASANAVAGVYAISHSGGDWSLQPTADPGSIVLPTTANALMHATDTVGTLSSAAASVFNLGNISAGQSGTAGYLASFPATASTGSLRLQAADNGGDFLVSIANALHGQASAYVIPDVGNAAGRILVGATATPFTDNNLIAANGTGGVVDDSGIAIADVQLNTNIIAATTADIGGSGAGPITVAVAGLTASSVVVATVESSSNPVSVVACTAGVDSFDITLSADPGAALLVNYIAFVAPQ